MEKHIFSISKNKNILLKVVLLVTWVVLLIFGINYFEDDKLYQGEKVVEVIDGDSFFISSKQNIRLKGLDAPDLENCFGDRAKKALSDKIINKSVILKELLTDNYGRIIALVYVNDELVNEYLIKNGYAISDGTTSSEHDTLSKANIYARDNKLGIFSDECYQIEPPNSDCLIKGNISETDNNKYYLTPDCRSYNLTVVEKYKGEQWFCDIKEAIKAGYKKHVTCI